VTVWTAATSIAAPDVDLGSDTDLLKSLWAKWGALSARNATRSVYYDGEAALKDFGISIPPAFSGVQAALGWSAKGVHAVTDRSQFEGMVSADGASDPLEVGSMLDENRFPVEFKAACVSSAVHGVSFLTVTRGDTAAGEPDVLILPVGADQAAGIWDKRTRRLSSFLTVSGSHPSGGPDLATMYTDDYVYSLSRMRNGRWVWSRAVNLLGFVSVAPLVHKYELRRPLGHSRITKASMYYSDAALRTILRSEVSSEFYSAVEYWLFGADVSKFVGDDKWSAVMGRVKAMDLEPQDDVPTLHRFNGASPEPHIAQMRMWANLFADDQDLDVKFADASNPSSADAIFAAKETLITTTRDANALWRHGAEQAIRWALMLRDRATEPSSEMLALRAQFTDPAIVSPSARADAFAKLASAAPGFGESQVGLEFAGLSQEQITRFLSEKRTSQVTSLVDSLRGAVPDGNG
jgi:hypothetical protein